MLAAAQTEAPATGEDAAAETKEASTAEETAAVEKPAAVEIDTENMTIAEMLAAAQGLKESGDGDN